MSVLHLATCSEGYIGLIINEVSIPALEITSTLYLMHSTTSDLLIDLVDYCVLMMNAQITLRIIMMRAKCCYFYLVNRSHMMESIGCYYYHTHA